MQELRAFFNLKSNIVSLFHFKPQLSLFQITLDTSSRLMLLLVDSVIGVEENQKRKTFPFGKIVDQLYRKSNTFLSILRNVVAVFVDTANRNGYGLWVDRESGIRMASQVFGFSSGKLRRGGSLGPPGSLPIKLFVHVIVASNANGAQKKKHRFCVSVSYILVTRCHNFTSTAYVNPFVLQH